MAQNAIRQPRHRRFVSSRFSTIRERPCTRPMTTRLDSHRRGLYANAAPTPTHCGMGIENGPLDSEAELAAQVDATRKVWDQVRRCRTRNYQKRRLDPRRPHGGSILKRWPHRKAKPCCRPPNRAARLSGTTPLTSGRAKGTDTRATPAPCWIFVPWLAWVCPPPALAAGVCKAKRNVKALWPWPMSIRNLLTITGTRRANQQHRRSG